jgi:hypothetical protein
MGEISRSQQYMVVETFKNCDAAAVYRRFRERGRMLPDGLIHISSWVSADLSKCYQLMECSNARLLEQWTACWSDLVDFEVVPVIQSAEAAQRIEAQGSQAKG